MKSSIEIYTDGSVTPPKNKGDKTPGGWAGIVVKNGLIVAEYSGNNPRTTISEMEVQALTFMLEDLTKKPRLFKNYSVYLYSDSNYCVRGYNEWMESWSQRGWINSSGKEVAQREYWERLKEYKEILGDNVQVLKIKGHSDDPFNNRADEVANKLRKELI